MESDLVYYFKEIQFNPEQNLGRHNYMSIFYNPPWHRYTVSYMYRDGSGKDPWYELPIKNLPESYLHVDLIGFLRSREDTLKVTYARTMEV